MKVEDNREKSSRIDEVDRLENSHLLKRHVSHIDHLGIAVSSLSESIKAYEALLGGKVDHLEDVPDQKVKTAFFQVGQSAFELLEATDPSSPIARFLERNPRGGLHHVCVAVDDIEAVLERYKEAGLRLIDQKPRRGAHNKWVAFIHPAATDGVLLELSQSGELTSEKDQ